jgi:hypothetical protein
LNKNKHARHYHDERGSRITQMIDAERILRNDAARPSQKSATGGGRTG